jgi:hypothetical protein
MSKALTKISSYFDWELKFRKTSNLKHQTNSIHNFNLNEYNFNSLGISNKSFKNFMKKWKDKNLS